MTKVVIYLLGNIVARLFLLAFVLAGLGDRCLVVLRPTIVKELNYTLDCHWYPRDAQYLKLPAPSKCFLFRVVLVQHRDHTYQAFIGPHDWSGRKVVRHGSPLDLEYAFPLFGAYPLDTRTYRQ